MSIPGNRTSQPPVNNDAIVLLVELESNDTYLLRSLIGCGMCNKRPCRLAEVYTRMPTLCGTGYA